MEFLTKSKQAEDAKHEGHQQAAPSTTEGASIRQPSPEPQRDLLTKLIAGSGHHPHHSHHPRPSSASSNGTVTQQNHHCQDPEQSRALALALALAQREAELRYKLDLLTKEKTENEGFFATLRVRFDHEAQLDKRDAHTAETPEVFWERFAAGEEMERKREGLERKEELVRGELAVVERERRELEAERMKEGDVEGDREVKA